MLYQDIHHSVSLFDKMGDVIFIAQLGDCAFVIYVFHNCCDLSLGHWTIKFNSVFEKSLDGHRYGRKEWFLRSCY